MKYLGGKQRLGVHLAPVIESYAVGTDGYLEPFCGSLGVLKRITLPGRVAADYHPDLIQMWTEVQAGTFECPAAVTEDEYLRAKQLPSPSALKAFVGFGMSFGGRFFGAYSQKYLGDKKEDFCKEMVHSLERTAPLIRDVQFLLSDYRDFHPVNKLVYCDPPYAQTRYPIKYRRDIKRYDTFDSSEFWDVMREWSQRNVVLISETSAPADFVEVWRAPKTRSASHSKNTVDAVDAVEKLFKLAQDPEMNAPLPARKK